MQDFYNDSKFIIAFLVLVLIMQAAVYRKVLSACHVFHGDSQCGQLFQVDWKDL